MSDHGERRAYPQGERIAMIEERQRGMEGDIAVIRKTLHEINNALQSMLREQMHIIKLTEDLPDIAQHARDYKESQADLKIMLNERQQRIGGHSVIVLGCSVVLGIAAIGASAATFFSYLMGHYK